MATTYDPIASTTLIASTTGVTFSSIPQTYRDLILVVSGTPNLADITRLRFNGDTAANYSLVTMEGNGSATYSGVTTSSNLHTSRNYSLSPSQVFTMRAELLDYSATDKHKTVLARTDSPNTVTTAVAGRWANTSAITQVYCYTGGGFQAGTVVSLYGIAA